ncbi:MAG: tRNA threonylcarbamoyladenosine biosynthesis protein [Parcubacteria group bacterium Gr01-1014_31]|nr:MAG: tRNA threonylcarbamoyladenosine biosynthesis protein [Parcubacteria group bacterium Gr01-1014_31]
MRQEIQTLNCRRLRPSELRDIGRTLRRGGVIVFPTDTAYAVGGRYDRSAVTRRVLEIKGRSDRRFTLVAASLAQVQRHFWLRPAALALARRFWPGPLSIVVSRRFAVRVPAHSLARQLAQRAGAPLIASSANRTGGRTPYRFSAVCSQLREIPPDLLLNGGTLPKRKPSTVVRVDGRGALKIIRAGSVRLRADADLDRNLRR